MLLCVRLSVWLLVVVWVPVCAWLFACRAVWLQRLFAVLRCAVRCAMIARVGGRQVVIRKFQNCILQKWIFQKWNFEVLDFFKIGFLFWDIFFKIGFPGIEILKK